MSNKKHLTQEGIEEIVKKRTAMNFGVSDKLMLSFPNVIPFKSAYFNS